MIDSKMLASHCKLLDIATNEHFEFEGNRDCRFSNWEVKKQELDDITFDVTLLKTDHEDERGKCLSETNSKNNEPLSSSRIRAIEWQAEAFSKTSEQPRLFIVNNSDASYREFLSHSEQWKDAGIDKSVIPGLQERLHNKTLSDHDKWLLKKGTHRLQTNTCDAMRCIRTRLSNKLIDQAGIRLKLPVMDQQNKKYYFGCYEGILCTAMLKTGLTLCRELSSYAAYRSFTSSKKTPAVIPVTCYLRFLGESLLFSKDLSKPWESHVFSVLIDKDEFFFADSKGWFSVFESEVFDPPLKMWIPIRLCEEAERLNYICREGIPPQNFDAKSTPAIFQSSESVGESSNNDISASKNKKLREDCVSKPNYIRKKTGKTEIDEIEKKYTMPLLFKKVTVVIADPWLQSSQRITKNNWIQYVRSVALACGLKSIKEYEVDFETIY